MMFRMSKAMVAAAVAALLTGALVSPASVSAQDPTNITGCLSKGAGEGTYTIKAEDGKTHELTSTTVALEGHVGHKVTVAGSPAGTETGALADTGMARDTAMAGDTGMTHPPGMEHDSAMGKHEDMGKEAGGGAVDALNVTSLKHISPACS
jgi:hypothetical protein